MKNEERLKIDFIKLIADFQVMYIYLELACDEDEDDRENLYKKGLDLYNNWMPLILKTTENFIKDFIKKDPDDNN